MKEQIDRILVDVTYRTPERRIVLRGTSYVLSCGSSSINIPQETIQELLESGHFFMNGYGGIVVSNSGKAYVETIVKHMRKPNPDQPGKQIDYCEVPEPYGVN
jgi:hypothetical protein